MIAHSYSQTGGFDNIGKFGANGIAWALVQRNNKFGFINSRGEEVVPTEYDDPDKIKINK